LLKGEKIEVGCQGKTEVPGEIEKNEGFHGAGGDERVRK